MGAGVSTGVTCHGRTLMIVCLLIVLLCVPPHRISSKRKTARVIFIARVSLDDGGFPM